MDALIRSSGINLFILLIAIFVIILFAAAFIILAAFFFVAKRKNIENGLDDDEIKNDVAYFLRRRLLKNKSNKLEDINNDINKDKQRLKIINLVSDYLIGLFFVFFVVMIGVSLSIKSQGDQMWLGDNAVLIIQTSSMETAYKGNTYLFDEEGKLNPDDRIEQYSYISISKDEKLLANIKPFDVVAFKMKKDSNGGGYITIVHRLIYVDKDENGEPLYTFRGDANASSLTGELKVRKEMLLGVHQTEGYKGSKNVAFGYFISYMQSNIGIIIVIVSFLMMGIYAFLFERLNKPYSLRFLYILSEEGNEISLKQSLLIENEKQRKLAKKKR